MGLLRDSLPRISAGWFPPSPEIQMRLHALPRVRDEADEVVGQCCVFAVRVASWTSDKRDALSPHDPIVGNTSAVIEIEGEA